jgi:hypothetical protein
MKYPKAKKQWKRPELKIVQLCCEATAYSEAMVRRR